MIPNERLIIKINDLQLLNLFILNKKIIFGSKKNISGPENLKVLDKNNIKTNIQIVLCPGINDGRDLTDTLFTLTNDFKSILSIGIVPVGITKFNSNCKLKPYTGESALKVIKKVNDFKKNRKFSKKSANIYLSDEFYILAGISFPDLSPCQVITTPCGDRKNTEQESCKTKFHLFGKTNARIDNDFRRIYNQAEKVSKMHSGFIKYLNSQFN